MLGVTKQTCERIHGAVEQTLERVGVEIGHEAILARLSDIGASVDAATSRARFPAAVVEGFLGSLPKVDRSARAPKLVGRAALFSGQYLDPATDRLVTMTPALLREYFRLAKALPHISSTFVTGCQWPVPPAAEPLWERFHAWKYGLSHAGTLYPLDTAPHILRLCELYAGLRGRPVKEVAGGGVFMVSPLRIPREEAAQFVWWWQRGFRVGIAHMTTGGLTAPVTVEGQVALNIAEAVAIALIHAACYGERSFSLMGMLSAADMRTMIRPYGRPELARANILLAEMARFYGVGCFAQSGLSDAKSPSPEAGAQKAMTTLATLMAGADTLMDCGTLSMDEVSSPIQMILDDELTGALEHLIRPLNVTEESLGSEVIETVGPGGAFIDSAHTALHMRECLWEPRIWSRRMLQGWQQEGAKDDIARAREIYGRTVSEAPDPEVLDPDCEQKLLSVIREVERGA